MVATQIVEFNLRQLKLQMKNHRLSFRVNARIRSALSNVLKSIFLVRFRMSPKVKLDCKRNVIDLRKVVFHKQVIIYDWMTCITIERSQPLVCPEQLAAPLCGSTSGDHELGKSHQ